MKTRVSWQFEPPEPALVEAIVTPGIAIYSVKLIAKPPFMDVPCHWHQDDAYYVKQSQSQTRMSVWVPLQDAHEQNGCLYAVDGKTGQAGITFQAKSVFVQR